MSEVILEVKDLKKYFKASKGTVHAVDGLNLTLEKGKTLGIVGESGCGKSTTGRIILRLLDVTSGSVIFDGKDVTKATPAEMRELRKDMQMIFQDPFSSLNPCRTVSQLIAEPIILNKLITGKDKKERIEARVLELMETVRLARRLYNTYPHELDGGRRQRIGIARALAMNPKFIVCDEPVSALNVSIQAQILNLLKDLQEKMDLTYIFITHNLSVVNHFTDEIAVMYLGSLVEKAAVEDLFQHPMHPYTKALLSAIPVPEITQERKKESIRGEITSPINLAPHCRFCKRCPYATQDCAEKPVPELQETRNGHFVACHRLNERGEII